MLDFLIQYGVNRKRDRPDLSGMSIVGGIDTKCGYLARLDPKLQMKTW